MGVTKVFKTCYLIQACDLLEGLIPNTEDKIQLPTSHMQRLFIFAIMWSIGALLEFDDRAKLEHFFLNHDSCFSYPALRDPQNIFEFFVDSAGKLLKC